MPPRVYFFSRQKHMYILDPPSHHKKGSLPVYHIIFIVLEFFHGIWRFWEYECTCLRIYILGCADNCTPQPMRSLSVPWCFSGNIHMYLVCTVYIYIESCFEKMMQTHPSMLEYASARPCTLHPMRFPEAMFFLTRIYIYIDMFWICTVYIYIHISTDWKLECHIPS